MIVENTSSSARNSATTNNTPANVAAAAAAANDDDDDERYRLNSGRIYKYTYQYQRPVDRNKNTESRSVVITLIEYLCSVSTKFTKAAWKRRILRGEISVDDSIVKNADHLMIPKSTQTLQAGHHHNNNSLIPMVVLYHRPPWKEPVVQVVEYSLNNARRIPTSHQLQILHQDEHMMAVHKPSGLPTMHSQTVCDYTILNALRQYATTETKNSTNSCNEKHASSPPQPVHRLGVGTSGVVLIATSPLARKHLSHAIRDKRVTKVYRALVTNNDALPDTLRIDCPIGPVPFPIGGGTIHAACPRPSTSCTYGVDNNGDSGTNDGSANKENTRNNRNQNKESLSLVRVVRRLPDTNQAIVDVEIPTGRPHQIRIHMAYAGHPLVGDPLYLQGGIPDNTLRWFPRPNKEEEDMDTDEEEECNHDDGLVQRVTLPRDCGYRLHAHRITVEHPTLMSEDGTYKKWMTFIAPPPADLT